MRAKQNFVLGWIAFLLSFQDLNGQTVSYSDPNLGKFNVGFRTILGKDRNQKPVLITIWFPAEANARKLTIKQIIDARSELGDSKDKVINDFKSVVSRIYDLGQIDDSAFENSISKTIHASLNSKMLNGKFPLVIAFADPSSYYMTFEFLASHGFVVASVTMLPFEPPPFPLHYTPFTDMLEDLLNFMTRQPYVDTSRVSAFGHGGGIQAAAYLAMRTKIIKRVVNLDGGFFGPRSKTTQSSDYYPEKFKVPLLHIVTLQQSWEDDTVQIRALKNKIFRVVINSDSVWHHDFTSFGRVAGLGLKIRKPMELINEVVYACDKIILEFLEQKSVSSNRKYFTIENFN